MAKKRKAKSTEAELRDSKTLSRRDFVKAGAAAGVGVGVGAAMLSAPRPAAAQSAADIQWDYEADIVILGGGATGLPAAIRSRDLGASVIVVEQNFEIGGRMLHSGGRVSLGGDNDPVLLRDIAGESDPDGYVTVAPLETAEAMTDSADILFRDMTDWSLVNDAGRARYRQNDPDMMRSWADNVANTRQLMLDNYVRFTRVSGTHIGGGLSRARRAIGMFKIGAVTDPRAGTVTIEDAGRAGPTAGGLPSSEWHSSRFAVRVMEDGAANTGPDTRARGTGVSRPLELSAKDKGVQFMLSRHADELIREEQFSGRVLGVRASYNPRLDPNTGERLTSYGEDRGDDGWANGLINETRETVTIRARKGVIMGTGGNNGDPQVRAMFYPAGLEPSCIPAGWNWLGPTPGRSNDASAMKMGMRIGANLAGMEQGYTNDLGRRVTTLLGTPDSGTWMYPGNPTFADRRAVGITVGNDGFEHLIVVNQVGKRFFNEMRLPLRPGNATYPGQAPTLASEYVQGDWRNCSAETIKASYTYESGIDAAMARNEGSQPPNYLPGPLWAIFDQAAVERGGWDIEPPFTGDPGTFFRADTIEELADAIFSKNGFQKMPLTHLKATVDRWNGFVNAGADTDFARGPDAPLHAIGTPPLYAANVNIEWHDSCGGLRINGKGQVLDMQGEVIPGLFAGGESVGGSEMHGLGRATTQGYIAASTASA